LIDEIANPRPVLVGETYEGTVVKTTTFGAFVNLVPGRDGLVHISKLGRGKRLQSVEEAVKEGDKLTVLVEDIDAQGKISLKPVGPEWEVPEGTDPNGGGSRPREDRGGRGGGERGGRSGERSGVPSGSSGGGGDKPRGRRFRDQPGGERTDTPPAE
jgi:polyribonucleotide nucleotidyltransferase